MEENKTAAPAKRGSKKKTEQPAPFEVSAAEVAPGQTGKIDLHLQSPEAIEETIKKEVAKLNEGFTVAALDQEKNKLSPREKIALLGEMFATLEIADLNDKEGYKKADDARKVLVKLRTGVAKKHEDLKANYLKVSRALDGEKNELTRLIETEENKLKAKIKVIDDLQKEADEKAEREKQEKRDRRVAEVKEAGAEFENGFYCVGPQISVDIVTLEMLSEDQFLALLGRVKEARKAIDFAKYKADQLVRVKQYLFERQQRKQNIERQKIEDEANQLKKERRDARVEGLEMLGCEANQNKTLYTFKNAAGTASIATADIETLIGDAWKNRFTEFKDEIKVLKDADETAKQQEETKKQKDAQDQARREAVKKLGYNYDPASGKFYLTTETYGDSNFYTETEITGAELFDPLLNEMKAAAEKTFKDHEDQEEIKQQKEARKNDRIGELVNGFGMQHTDGVNYKRVSKFEAEPELSNYIGVLYVSIADVSALDEQQWTEKIKGLTALNSQIQHAEQLVQDRKKSEADAARLSALSKRDQIVEYLSKVEAMAIPIVNDKTPFIWEIESVLKEAFFKCQGLVKDFDNLKK